MGSTRRIVRLRCRPCCESKHHPVLFVVLSRVLYNERETLPRDLPPEFVSAGQGRGEGQSRVLKLLEWGDMVKRRRHVVIPEFYPGSILRVTYADTFATNGWLVGWLVGWLITTALTSVCLSQLTLNSVALL